ncbi:MAG: DUF1361 domain-containing protein [Acidimicrobiales bacterium]
MRALLGDVLTVVHDNRLWMTWNLALAASPVLLAASLFRVRHRTRLWWLGLVAFVLVLPNAPYVLTDLIHLRADVAAAPSDLVVVFGVLPLYALFLSAGMCAYVYALGELVGYAGRSTMRIRSTSIEVGAHMVCAVGIVLGRIARLNSWDPLTAPVGSLERIVTTLSWRGAPVAVLVVFLAVWAGHTIARVLIRSALDWGARQWGSRVADQ